MHAIKNFAKFLHKTLWINVFRKPIVKKSNFWIDRILFRLEKSKLFLLSGKKFFFFLCLSFHAYNKRLAQKIKYKTLGEVDVDFIKNNYSMPLTAMNFWRADILSAKKLFSQRGFFLEKNIYLRKNFLKKFSCRTLHSMKNLCEK